MLLKRSVIESTHKSRETEETLDVIFYRPLGYLMALASMKAGITPNAVTIFSIFVGVIAGHFFYYDNLSLNLIGILLLIWAEALDSTDGQLARMTNNKSMYGRILDGFGGNMWFVSIYIHLILRLVNSANPSVIIIFAVTCGISHSMQSAMADYYRNLYMLIVFGNDKSEIETSDKLNRKYKQLSWRKNFGKKLLMRLYVNYTFEQEFISPAAYSLLNMLSTIKSVPENISAEYRFQNRKMIKYYNILTTNTRMIVLFISTLAGYPVLYFVFEATVLNILLLYVVKVQEKNSRSTHVKLLKAGYV
jgi:phosphatidylglycerophosphate synthase